MVFSVLDATLTHFTISQGGVIMDVVNAEQVWQSTFPFG